jgi:hypothetical protein
MEAADDGEIFFMNLVLAYEVEPDEVGDDERSIDLFWIDRPWSEVEESEWCGRSCCREVFRAAQEAARTVPTVAGPVKLAGQESSLDPGKFPLFRSKEIPARNMELRKSPPLERGGIPARNRNERTRIAEFVGKSSLDPGEFPLSRSKEILVGNMELRKFPPLERGRIPDRIRNKRSGLDLGKFLPPGSEEVQCQSVSGR